MDVENQQRPDVVGAVDPPLQVNIDQEDGAWQLRMTSTLERDDYIYNNELWTDCNIVVGSETDQKTFSCHRIYLAKCSPVLAKMFYGESKKDEIYLPEITPSAFAQVLSYIYTDSISQLNWEGLVNLSKAARFLELPHLLHSCLNHLRSEVKVSNVCTIHELVKSTGTTGASLANYCFRIMCDNAARVLEEPSIVNVSQDTLVALLKQDNLHVASDIPLIEACVKWAKFQVKKTSKLESPYTLRDALGPAFGLLRFLSLTPAQFAAYPGKLDLLSLEECLAVLSNLSSPGIADLPMDFSKMLETRHGYLFGHGRVFLCQPSMEKNVYNVGQPKWCENAFEFEVTSDLILIGAQIPSQVVVHNTLMSSTKLSVVAGAEGEKACSLKPNGATIANGHGVDKDEEETYVEDLDITFEKPKPRSRVAMHFDSTVRYNSLISLKFDKPFLILRNEKYRMYVHLRKKGWYPTGKNIGNIKLLGAELNYTAGKENYFHSLIFTR